MILGATDQKLWMFEVFRRSLVKASMCWRPAVETWLRPGDQRSPTIGRRPEVPNHWSPTLGCRPRASWRPIITCRLRVDTYTGLDCPFFFEIFLFLYNFFWKFGEWTRAFGRMGVQHLHFLKLACTLGSIKCSISHGDWRCHFFSNFIFSKFRVHMDLHIYHWDFGFMKD
jgi:hypothetical protein